MKIIVCDDHPIFRGGLVAALTELRADSEVSEAADAAAAIAAVDAGDVGLVLLDLHMPGTDGWAVLRALRTRHPAVAVVVVSASEDGADMRRALDAGASGYIPKSTPAPLLGAALEVVLSGGIYVPPQLIGFEQAVGAAPDDDRARRRERAHQLTPRQREVLILMSRGLSNREIGEQLGIAVGTVKTHVAALLEILDVSNRTEATLIMTELDLESDEESAD